MADDSIVLIGGRDNGMNSRNDVWRSIDNGTTWTEVTASAGLSPTWGYNGLVMPDDSIVLLGGTNGGSTYYHDVWRSMDKGATWAAVTGIVGWSPRVGASSVAMPDGSIVLTGGWDGIPNLKNDVWRFIPSGSLVRNPVHTFTTPGTYQVSLQAYNAIGYNSTQKARYITVWDNEGTDSGGDIPSPLTPNPTTTLVGKTITETVNVGGGSAVSRAEVTGTNLGKNLVVTAFPRNNLPSGIDFQSDDGIPIPLDSIEYDPGCR